MITGNGTYTVSLDKDDFADIENLGAANGVRIFDVDIKEICHTQKFDASQMAVTDVIVKCDGDEIPVNLSKMYEGNIFKANDYRLEIRDEYGYQKGDFTTKVQFDRANPSFIFEKTLAVTFTIQGIKDGKTPEDAFTTSDGDRVVAVGGDRAKALEALATKTPLPSPTNTPLLTPTAKPSETPEATPGETPQPTPGSTGTVTEPPKSDTSGSQIDSGKTENPIPTETPVSSDNNQEQDTYLPDEDDEEDDKDEKSNPIKKITAPKQIVVKKGKSKTVIIKLQSKIKSKKTTDEISVVVTGKKKAKISGRKYNSKRLTFTVKGKKKGSTTIYVIIGEKSRKINLICI